MTLKNALVDIALDDSVLEVDKSASSLQVLLGRIAGALGLAVEPSNGRLRVNVETGAVTATVSGNITTVTTVTTVSAITATNGFGTVGGANVNPGQNMIAGMVLPALELRNRIAVT